MQIVYLAIASLVGLAIGYLIGMAVLKSKTSAWEERLAAAKEKLESIKREATASVEAARARTQELEKRLSGVQEEATQLKKKVEEEHQAAVEAQGKLQEVETARTKAVELVEAHKAARQQAEGRLKQAETLTAQVQQELGKAQQQIQTLEKNKATVEKKAQQQAKEIERLRSAGDTAPAGESTAGLEGSVEAFANSDGTLESVLKVLMEQEGQTAAVLSDANGIIVAGAGDNGLREGMAATTKLVGSITAQLEGMVPFAKLRSYHLEDDKTNVISGRAFLCAGETVGLATYGPRVPSRRLLDGAMANLSSILE